MARSDLIIPFTVLGAAFPRHATLNIPSMLYDRRELNVNFVFNLSLFHGGDWYSKGDENSPPLFSRRRRDKGSTERRRGEGHFSFWHLPPFRGTSLAENESRKRRGPRGIIASSFSPPFFALGNGTRFLFSPLQANIRVLFPLGDKKRLFSILSPVEILLYATTTSAIRIFIRTSLKAFSLGWGRERSVHAIGCFYARSQIASLFLDSIDNVCLVGLARRTFTVLRFWSLSLTKKKISRGRGLK